MNDQYNEYNSAPVPTQDEIIRRRNAQKKRIARKRLKTDKMCLWFVGILFGVISLANIFQFNRPTVSEVEKRELKQIMPATFSSLVSGDFFESINGFFADTFIFRDSIVATAQKLDTLRGFDYSVGDENFSILTPGTDSENNVGNMGDKIDDLLNEDKENDKPKPPVTDNLALSKNEVKLTMGGTAVIDATFAEGLEAKWILEGDSVTMTSSGASAIVKASAEGEATLKCIVGDKTVECKITVVKVDADGVNNGDTADFMTNGLFIYGDAVYTKPWYIESNTYDYAKVMAYYKKLFPNSRVNVCIAPTSSIVIDNDTINSQLEDQEAIFKRTAEIMADKDALGGQEINFVNMYYELFAHRNEYVYFKSDHHWTQLGAYYGYRAFAESVGLVPVELSDFNKVIITETYNGSMYDYTKDERVKTFLDTVEAYMSKKTLTMTVTDKKGNESVYNEAIMTWIKGYTAFLCSDNPFTVINVPENPQDKTILVFKDSYGNAMIPFLAEHYGTIMVVDTRYTGMNVYEMFGDQDIDDILFINNLEAANSPAWAKMYLKAVGQ